MKEDKIDIVESIENKNIKETKEEIPVSAKVLKVQKMLNQIKINDKLIIENGLYNDETIAAIKKLQKITKFEENGKIDQNLMFRLKEIIDNPKPNKRQTFACLYWGSK